MEALQASVFSVSSCSSLHRLRRREPEELLRGGEGKGVRTRRSGKVGERAGEGERGLQIESGVGPGQHQLIGRQLKINVNNGGQILDADNEDLVDAKLTIRSKPA